MWMRRWLLTIALVGTVAATVGVLLVVRRLLAIATCATTVLLRLRTVGRVAANLACEFIQETHALYQSFGSGFARM